MSTVERLQSLLANNALSAEEKQAIKDAIGLLSVAQAAIAVACDARMKGDAPSDASTKQLRTTIRDIDCASQCTFSAIAALCRLALASMEAELKFDHAELLAQVFSIICDRATDTEDYINSEAEQVGCHYNDAAMSRRYQAQRQACKDGAA